MEREDSLAVDLVRRNLEREANERYKGFVVRCVDALKQVGLNKSPGQEGLPYEVYLRMSHMFVPILTDVFNHWFALE